MSIYWESSKPGIVPSPVPPQQPSSTAKRILGYFEHSVQIKNTGRVIVEGPLTLWFPGTNKLGVLEEIVEHRHSDKRPGGPTISLELDRNAHFPSQVLTGALLLHPLEELTITVTTVIAEPMSPSLAGEFATPKPISVSVRGVTIHQREWGNIDNHPDRVTQLREENRELRAKAVQLNALEQDNRDLHARLHALAAKALRRNWIGAFVLILLGVSIGWFGVPQAALAALRAGSTWRFVFGAVGLLLLAVGGSVVGGLLLTPDRGGTRRRLYLGLSVAAAILGALLQVVLANH
jgi:hypothetical protein